MPSWLPPLLRRAIARPTVVLGAAAALAGLPVRAPLAAQAPADRAAIQAFRDSLDRVRDSTGLAALEQRLIDVAKGDRNNALHHLRLGFVAIRLGDLGSKKRYDDGAGEFEWATDLQPEWPWAWYGLGLAEDRVGDSRISLVSGLQAMFGKDHLTRAANAYARSVQVDPSFVLGLVELASTALRQRVNIKTDLAREALRVAAQTTAAKNPEVLLFRGRVEREVGDIDSAHVAFTQYLALGGQRGVGLLELARTRFVRGTLDGQMPYYEGAALDDSLTVAMYHADLATVANDSALAEFDYSSGERRAAFLRRFWAQRDHDALLAEGERLREHYRRLFYARKSFRLVSLNRHYDIVERYRSGSKEYDDRGIIYIRHGEPTRRATYNAPGMKLNESWQYERAGGDLIFHFVANEDVQDYKLVESVFDILGFSTTVALRGDRDNLVESRYANELILTREPFSPIYSQLLTAGTTGSQKYFTDERAIGQRSIRLGTRTDSYELTYASRLRVETGVVVAGRDSGRALLHVTYAIPGAALHPVPSERGHLYPVRLRLSVTDAVGKTIATLDTTRLFVAHDPVPPREHLVGRIAVPVIAGPLRYRLAIEQGDDNGVVFPIDTLNAGDFSGQAFALSGLVLGSREANLSWRPVPGDTVWFNPLSRFARKNDLEVYYEVYGVAAGAPIRTELTVTKEGGGGFLGLFGSRKPAIRLGFEEQSEGPATRIHRTVSLADLAPGRYRVDVVVRNPEGGERRSVTSLEVRP
ncbi:MAG: GWxTD domain-containing protein [Gemmatimonadetes bacterium]|nr:GWxTD domain-containing protein [Gemmatimonadota bacterium]